jgi:hypothetical protein
MHVMTTVPITQAVVTVDEPGAQQADGATAAQLFTVAIVIRGAYRLQPSSAMRNGLTALLSRDHSGDECSKLI